MDFCCPAQKKGWLWWVYATAKDDDGVIQVRKVEYQHSCLGAALPSHTTANSQSWLLRVIPKILIVMCETTVQDIINTVRLHFHKQISYQAAHETKSPLLKTHSIKQARQFQRVPAYINAIKQQCPLTHTNLFCIPHALDASIVYFRLVFVNLNSHLSNVGNSLLWTAHSSTRIFSKPYY